MVRTKQGLNDDSLITMLLLITYIIGSWYYTEHSSNLSLLIMWVLCNVLTYIL